MRRLALNLHIQDRFATFINRAIELHDVIGQLRHYFAERTADMSFDRQTVDLRHPLVDADIAVILVHQDEANRRVPIDLLDLGQSLPNVAMESLDLLLWRAYRHSLNIRRAQH